MKQNVLNNEFTGKSPCFECHYEKHDKNECSELCIALKRFRLGQAYSDIDRYRKVEPAMRDVTPDINVVEIEPDEKTRQVKENVCRNIKKCLICGREESDKVKIRRGLCILCYQNWREGKLKHPLIGDFVKMTPKELNEARYGKLKKCPIDGCSEVGDRRGLCQRHYKKWQKGRLLHPELGEFVSTRKPETTVVTKISGMENELRKWNLDKTAKLEGKKEMDFNDIVEHRIEQIRTVLTQKAKEYATDQDRWHNFNRAGEILGISSERALVGMMVKHFVSVLDLVTWGETCPEKLDDAIIDEKIGDNCNYLILLEGLLKKRINKK